MHPYFTNEPARQASLDAGILVEAWSPIAQGGVLDDTTIVDIAKEVGRTPAQVTLRWHLQRGDIIFPKSSTPARMAENFALFDFHLDDASMEAITALNRGEDGRTGPHRTHSTTYPIDPTPQNPSVLGCPRGARRRARDRRPRAAGAALVPRTRRATNTGRGTSWHFHFPFPGMRSRPLMPAGMSGRY